jgi:hypothetical protein
MMMMCYDSECDFFDDGEVSLEAYACVYAPLAVVYLSFSLDGSLHSLVDDGVAICVGVLTCKSWITAIGYFYSIKCLDFVLASVCIFGQ